MMHANDQRTDQAAHQTPTVHDAPTPRPPSITEHELETTSGRIRYRVTAGRMLVGAEDLDDGVYSGYAPRAEVFVTSYTRIDVEDAVSRPVVFAFNGGPGSSSAWLHVGLFGPRLADSGDVDERTPPPYGLRDNPQTLLADADLVFIDPMSTGWSRATPGRKPQDHHGFTADRDLVGETIRLWLGRNDRWLSPKLLAGESYGTTRAAALAGSLAQRHGIAFNGLILISAVLEFGSIVFTPGNDEPYVHYLPTYAALASYHGLRDGDLETIVDEAVAFAEGPYRLALAKGLRLGVDERQALAVEIGRIIGLDPEVVLRNDLRLEHKRFFAELLRSRGQVIGRLDGRVVAPAGDAGASEQQVDPANQLIQYPYTAATNHYLRTELGIEQDMPYEILTDRVQPWSYAEFENRHVSTSEALAFAMRAIPGLRVYCAYGYYDGATPFAAAEHVFAHLAVPESDYRAIMRRTYEAGHMMYVHEPSRIAQSSDIAQFVAWAADTGDAPDADPILGDGGAR